jgi:serine/threonine-protein kinase
VHVADFGIASAAGLESLTQTGTVLGTASYLAPEQAMGERATPASDLYSLAVVAFELITGQRPFEADSVAAEAAAHVTGVIPSVCDVDPRAPCELDPVFARALAKHPQNRYPSAAEFVAALRAALDQAAGATRVFGATAPTRRTVTHGRRRSWLVPLLVLATLALAGIAAALGLTRGGGHSSSPARPQPVRITTVVKSVTRPGQTVVSTAYVTTSTPAPAATPTTTASTAATTTAAGSAGDPVTENNDAYALMKQGQFQQALPLLQDAAAKLRGQGNLAEAYTDYNLGYTLIQLGNCSAAMPYLQRSWELQHGRREVRAAINQAKRC